jgi:hypothetical protein
MQLGVQNAQLQQHQQQLLPSAANLLFFGNGLQDFVFVLIVVSAVCYNLLCLKPFQAPIGLLLL